MSGSKSVETRVRLAQGHWELGEHGLAMDCLEKAAAEDPTHAELLRLCQRLVDEAARDPGAEPWAERVGALLARLSGGGPLAPSEVRAEEEDRELEDALEAEEIQPDEVDAEELPPFPTSTLAELLEQQGLTNKAVRVAREALARNPKDGRARAVLGRLTSARGDRGGEVIAELERWLGRIRRRRAEGGMHG